MIKCCLAAGLSWDYYGISDISDLWDTLLSSSTLPEVHHIASDTDRLKRLQSGHLQTEHFHSCRNWNRWLWFMAYYSLSKPLHFKRVYKTNTHCESSIKMIQHFTLSDPSTQVQLYKTVSLLVAFLVIAFLKGFIGFIRGRLTWDGWCLTSVIAEGRLVLCRSIDPQPTRTWSLEPPTLMSDWFTDDWHLLAGSQDPWNSGMLWLVTHPSYMRCFYLLTPVFSITCWWVAVRSAGLPIAIVC